MAGEWVASVYSRLGLESVALRRVATQGSPWNLLPIYVLLASNEANFGGCFLSPISQRSK
jgi:hypothetical protein